VVERRSVLVVRPALAKHLPHSSSRHDTTRHTHDACECLCHEEEGWLCVCVCVYRRAKKTSTMGMKNMMPRPG
jgi:hypothetical protein